MSDRIGRLKIILAGCLIAALTYFPLFHGLTTAVNPAVAEFQAANPVVLRVDPATCGFHIFVGPWSKFTECDKSKDFLTKAGLSFTTEDAPAGTPPSVSIGQTRIDGWDTDKWNAALAAAGYPKAADPARINWVMAEVILVIMMIYVTMVYGPIAAFLVDFSRPASATRRCRCPTTSEMAGSAECCRCLPRQSSRAPAISITACGIRSWLPS